MNLGSKIAVGSLLILGACFPKEDAVQPIPRENVAQSIDAGEFKNGVSFFSLESGKIIAEASPMEWDFYIDDEVIRLNYFRSMRAAKTDKSWHEINDTIGLDFQYLTSEVEDGLGMWELEENQIYVIDYGFDDEFNAIGLVSVKIERLVDEVRITYADIGVAYEVYESIPLTSFYYNLREKKLLELPEEGEYDIAFGKYTDYVTIDETSQDYLIYGALMGNASSYRLDKPFADVEAEDVVEADLNPEAKAIIGWDWKTYNLNKGAYDIDADRTYVVKSNSGFKYKLRFVSFYNDFGVSGHPTFEYKLL